VSELFELYQKLGNEGYGDAIGKIAPYFSTITPKFNKLAPGSCEIVIPNTTAVHNHIGTVHAIAICNGAELVAGVTTDVSIPDTHRWIPVGMTVEYLAKAKTDITVRVAEHQIDWTTVGEVVVPVEAFDSQGIKVFTAQIRMLLGKK